MSAGFKLGLPIDIPWKRICVTEDMLDRVVCDARLPPKWQSSIAVFRYRPDDEYQVYPDYDISYLKVTVTITGYQALTDEIQGSIDWDGLDITTKTGVTELLTSYFPCTGAILQVVVGPNREGSVPLKRFPFFMDFEPKKRELYEMATDTKEKSSRSLESLALGKSSGTTKSQEVLDVDMGGSFGFGMEGSYAGTGGGFNVSASNQGQWGTKSLNSAEAQSTRTTELATERRETQSFTTQLSQMYHLLDSYHLGTNRAVFFVQPRPHVLEEPSGFVRGPRKVEGIQEFFLVVANPKDNPDYCVSARLDTAHLTETDILDYEYKSETSDLAAATARTPTRGDTPDGTTTHQACFGGCWDITYVCFRTNDADDAVYNAPPGFEIIGHTDLVNQRDSHGSSSVTVTPNRRTLTVHAEADGHICFEDEFGCVDCPDEKQKWTGSARRQVQVQLRSTERTRKVGTTTSLLITTRGLCCCDSGPEPGKTIIVVELPPHLAVDRPVAEIAATTVIREGDSDDAKASKYAAAAQALKGSAARGDRDDDCNCHKQKAAPESPRMSLRRANALSDAIRDELVKSIAAPELRTTAASFLETELFTRQVEAIMARSRQGREQLSSPAKGLPDKVAKALARRLNRKPGDLIRRDVVRLRNVELVREAGISLDDVVRLKLEALGLPLKKPKAKEPRKKD